MAETKVTPNEISQPASFSVYRNSAASLTTNTNTKVTFDTELWDTGSNFASGTFTAPVAGFYVFNWCIDITSTAGGIGISMLYKNGAEYKRGSRSTLAGAGTMASCGSGQMQMAAGDTAEIYGYFSAGTITLGVGFAPTTWFDGYMKNKV